MNKLTGIIGAKTKQNKNPRMNQQAEGKLDSLSSLLYLSGAGMHPSQGVRRKRSSRLNADEHPHPMI